MNLGTIVDCNRVAERKSNRFRLVIPPATEHPPGCLTTGLKGGVMFHRRLFLKTVPAAAAALAFSRRLQSANNRTVMTVRGPIRSSEMGITLSHEHVLANFQPLAEREKRPWTYDQDEVVKVVRPYLEQVRKLG